ncbi:hypothetical protein LSH36_1639g00002 [Paralvinella palmiformis]|nr:hypothetical protein LSH36_1639g00002 [Paralvinella palmiformis]
MTVMFY